MRASPFILASASPRRLALLEQIGLPPDHVISPEIDETPTRGELPAPHALRLALQKASAVAIHHPDATILAADTVVACGLRILPKAEDKATATQCLQLLSGRRHQVHTAVVLLKQGTTRQITVSSRVKFRRLSTQDIRDYLASGEWQGKAGGYAIQGKAAAFIPWINGSYSAIVGLPLAETALLLSSLVGVTNGDG